MASSEYNTLIKDFHIKDDYAFESIRIEFQDKVNFGSFITFLHPSYSEALPYILSDKKINTEIFRSVNQISR